VKKWQKIFWRAGMIFSQKNMSQWSAATTFFALLSAVPLLLLLIRTVGLLFGNVSVPQDKLFQMVLDIFPSATPDLVLMLKKIVTRPLFVSKKVTFLNLIVLAWSSFSFINSVWAGFYHLKDQIRDKALKKMAKGFVVIFASMVLLTLIILVPTVAYLLTKAIKDNFVTSFLIKWFPESKETIKYLVKKQFGFKYLIEWSIFYYIFFLGYFTFLYRWFYGKSIVLKEAMVGALTFMFVVVLGKNLFWIYLKYGRESLMRNYGDLYTLVLGVMWLFMLNSIFFYGGCLCRAILEEKEARNVSY
jgi:membrane protein